MKQTYLAPELEVTKISREDILAGSDVLIDGSDLFTTTED